MGANPAECDHEATNHDGLCLCGDAGVGSVNAKADIKSEYFDKLFENDVERLESIDDVLLTKETMGLSRAEYYEQTASVELANGERAFMLNHMPLTEIQRRHAGDSGLANATPEQPDSAAADIELIGRDAEAGIQQEI